MFSLIDPQLQILNCPLTGAFGLLAFPMIVDVAVLSFIVLLVFLIHYSYSLFPCVLSFLGLPDYLILFHFHFPFCISVILSQHIRVCSVHVQLVKLYFLIALSYLMGSTTSL